MLIVKCQFYFVVDTFFGYKLGQTQTFDNQGIRLPVTKISCLALEIKQIKTELKDGYKALVVKVKKQDVKKGKETLREIKVKDLDLQQFKIGNQINLEQVFKENDKVKVTGITKGKGFAGGMKRWGFSGGPRTHGQSDRKRAPGSIGQGTDPGRIWKGKKMAGRMGGVQKTIRNLKIYKIDKEKNELWLKGLVPGPKSGLLKITKISK